MKETSKLQNLLVDLNNCISVFETTNTKVSKASVGWHLDHSLKVINGVSKSLIKSDPKNYQTNFNKSRFFCFTFGFIPRGKGKAPKVVRPPEKIIKEEIIEQLQTATILLGKTEDLPKNSNFKHMIFGLLNKRQTLKFLCLHTQHHLKIIRDILK